MHFRWNRDRLIDRYSDAQSSVLKEVGEPVDEEDAGAPESISPPSQSAPNGLHPIVPPALKISTSKSLKAGLRSKAASVLSSPLRKRPRRETPRETYQAVPDPPSNACGVCFESLRDEGEGSVIDVDAVAGLSLRCKHRFCEDCWGTYLRCKIQDEAQCAIKCMEVKCPTFVEESFLLKLVGSSKHTVQR